MRKASRLAFLRNQLFAKFYITNGEIKIAKAAICPLLMRRFQSPFQFSLFIAVGLRCIIDSKVIRGVFSQFLGGLDDTSAGF